MSEEKTAELAVLDNALCDFYDRHMSSHAPFAFNEAGRMDNPWSRAAHEEDARRLEDFQRTRIGVPWDEIKSWMETWGTAAAGPPPACRKL